MLHTYLPPVGEVHDERLKGLRPIKRLQFLHLHVHLVAYPAYPRGIKPAARYSDHVSLLLLPLLFQ